jgi:hypothetical protein
VRLATCRSTSQRQHFHTVREAAQRLSLKSLAQNREMGYSRGMSDQPVASTGRKFSVADFSLFVCGACSLSAINSLVHGDFLLALLNGVFAVANGLLAFRDYE